MEEHKRDQHEHRQHDDKSARNLDMPKQPHRTPDKQGDPDRYEAPRVEPHKHDPEPERSRSTQSNSEPGDESERVFRKN
jgi:hypothetical protein